jgi:hypothetical protein
VIDGGDRPALWRSLDCARDDTGGAFVAYLCVVVRLRCFALWGPVGEGHDVAGAGVGAVAGDVIEERHF